MGWIVSLFQSVLYVSGLLGLYYFYGFYHNESYQYNQIQTSTEFLISLPFTIIFCAIVLARKYKKPSDYFLLLYGLIVIVPYGVLNNIYREAESQIVIDIILLLIPYSVVMLICSVEIRLPNFIIIREDNFLRLFVAVSAIVCILLLINRPELASFSLIDSYDRRLEARDTYGSGNFMAYISSMVMNGILPLFAFIGAINKKIVYLIISIVLYIVFFYIYGIKAPLLYLIFAAVLGYSMRNSEQHESFYKIFYYVFMSLIAFAWIEILLFEYSFIEDYLIRRIFYVGSSLVGVYFNFMDSNQFSWMYGLLEPTDKGISMYIGEDFLGAADTNANTNTFIYYLAQHGVMGYIFSIILVSIWLSVMNQLEFKSRAIVFISVLYSILILEQSATTALVSSGIGLIFLHYIFTIPKAE